VEFYGGEPWRKPGRELAQPWMMAWVMFSVGEGNGVGEKGTGLLVMIRIEIS